MLSNDTNPYILSDDTMEITFGPETRHKGAKIEVRIGLSLGDVMDLWPVLGDLNARDMAGQREPLEMFAEHLIVDWNLHRHQRDEQGRKMFHPDGSPILEKLPVTGANFIRQVGFGLAYAAMAEWQKVMATEVMGVAAPLEMPVPPTSAGQSEEMTADGSPSTQEPGAAYLSLLS